MKVRKLTDNPAHRFPVSGGLKVQAEDIARWAGKLNDDTLNALRSEAEVRNAELNDESDGYSVWRGNQITEWILNYGRQPDSGYTFIVS